MPPALPVIQVTGPRRNVGKTWLASRIIERLTAEGYAVAAVKHSHHSLPPDRPGSDTARFESAGAQQVVFRAGDGTLIRLPRHEGGLADIVRTIGCAVDVVVVEGFKDEPLGASVRIAGDTERRVQFRTADGELLLTTSIDDVEGITRALVQTFRLCSAGSAALNAGIRRAAMAHGHRCPGVTLGVRMANAAAERLGIALPAERGMIDVTVETARCATDAIAAVTGCSLGRGDLHVHERGVLAAVFIATASGRALRVEVRPDARAAAPRWALDVCDVRHAQEIAYRVMPDEVLLNVLLNVQTVGASMARSGA